MLRILWNALFCGRASEIHPQKSSPIFKEVFIGDFVYRKFVFCVLVDIPYTHIFEA
jgi:hypothetical protein